MRKEQESFDDFSLRALIIFITVNIACMIRSDLQLCSAFDLKQQPLVEGWSQIVLSPDQLILTDPKIRPPTNNTVQRQPFMYYIPHDYQSQ